MTDETSELILELYKSTNDLVLDVARTVTNVLFLLFACAILVSLLNSSIIVMAIMTAPAAIDYERAAQP